MEAQFDSHTRASGHSYTKYNKWETVWEMPDSAAFLRTWEFNQLCHINPRMILWQIEAWIQQVATDNPDLVTQSVIGTTFEGRNIYVLKVTIFKHDISGLNQ